MGLNLNLTFPLQSTSSACTSSISVRTTSSGESPRLETWEKFQAGRLLHLLQEMLLSQGFLITSALQTSTKGTYPIRSLLNYHSHFLIGDTHCSTSLTSVTMDFHNTNLLMSLRFSKPVKGSCCTGTVPVPYLTWKAYLTFSCFSNTYLIFSLSSLKAIATSNYLKSFP